MADLSARYRFEGATACIDVRVKSVELVFDSHDIAPLHERDLDEDVRSYVVACIEELPRKTPIKVVFWLAEPSPIPDDELSQAISRHFTFDRVRVDRQVRQKLRLSRWMLLVGLFVLAFFLSISELTVSWGVHPIGKVVHEGFVIIGWVAMWRPLEAILYDWWPLVMKRSQLDRLARAPVEVRAELPR